MPSAELDNQHYPLQHALQSINIITIYNSNRVRPNEDL